jgi:hypothetical protein
MTWTESIVVKIAVVDDDGSVNETIPDRIQGK